MVKKNLQNPSGIKNNICETQNVQFFSKSRINLTEKLVFIRFHSVGPEHCFSLWENFPKFKDKVMYISLSKKSTYNHLNNNFVLNSSTFQVILNSSTFPNSAVVHWVIINFLYPCLNFSGGLRHPAVQGM